MEIILAIIRNKSTKKYSIINNQVLEDARLSFKARGLLIYMLSKPDNWQFYSTELVKHSEHDGITAIKSALKELEVCGYLQRIQQRAENGKFGSTDWLLNDCPANLPQAGFSATVHPTMAKPQTEKPQLQSTEGTKNLKNQALNSSCSSQAIQAVEPSLKQPQTTVQDPNPLTSVTPEQNVKNPWELWQANWSFPNSIAQQDLSAWITQFGNELVYHALEYALKSNVSARGADRYLTRVFDSYEKNKVVSVAQALEQEEQHYQQRTRELSQQKSSRRHQRPVQQKEQLPEWAKPGFKAPEESAAGQAHKAQLRAEIQRRLAEIKAE
ncbi:hypothetical protein LPAF129_14330 [Ligilactobacillus pabuli]|uniref:DnaB/C C-terminal domain-containing protein n=1 Tax=Ligilactobacillus pabuli TaxID=2886039 RepID=A0ABQ5JI81_9LACO|nr:hypothetical protein LPAF129_14330 [Ligilactobacillus pabuli]